MTNATATIPPKRTEAAQAAIDAYRQARGFESKPDEDAIDLIVDVLHLSGHWDSCFADAFALLTYLELETQA